MSGSFSLLPILADAGVPMLFLTFPAMLLLLIPIIIVEGLLCKKWLGITTWESMKANAFSNLASTVIGIPVAWAIMLGVEFATAGIVDWKFPNQDWDSPIVSAVLFLLNSAWIRPPARNQAWLIPAAVLVLLVPFFLASYGIEYLIVRHVVGIADGGPPNLSYPRVRIAVWNANLLTCAFMFVGTAGWLLTQLPHH